MAILSIVGGTMIIAGLCLRAFLYPAEISLSGQYTDRARVFFNPWNVFFYKLFEKTFRIGGSLLLVRSIAGSPSSMGGTAAAAISFGLLAFFAAPLLAFLLSRLVYGRWPVKIHE
mgnify:CR=1 FL=1